MMRIKKFLKNKWKLLLVNLLFIALLVIVVLNISNTYSLTDTTTQLYYNTKENILIEYNTVLVPMDKTLAKIFSGYDATKNSQTVTYSGTTFEINKQNKIINVPIEYKNGNTTINDSVKVEIEQYNNTYYIPLYLITSIDGIQVKLDNVNIYDSDNYYNSISAIDSTKTNHSVEIIYNPNKTVPSTTYNGQEDGALWREEAYKRIEKNRKGDLTIVVKDTNGNIINNAAVEISMNENDFYFGTAIRYNSGDQNKFTGILPYENSKNIKLFSRVVDTGLFKWPLYNDDYKIKRDKFVEIANSYNFKIRGHCLYWEYTTKGSSVPKELKELINGDGSDSDPTMKYIYEHQSEKSSSDLDKLISKLKTNFETIVFEHIKKEISDYPYIDEWDVVNEILNKYFYRYYLYDTDSSGKPNFLTNSDFETYEDPSEDKYRYVFNEEYIDFIIKCYTEARKTLKENGNTSAKLVLNEEIKLIGHYDKLISLVNQINSKSKNIDIVSYQYHLSNDYRYTPQFIYNILKTIAEEANVEVAVTEYDNYTSKKFNEGYTNAENKIRADYLKDALIATYSNTSANGFTFWEYNVQDPSTGKNYFSDEEKETYEEIIEEWLNDKQTLSINNENKYSTRAYLGNYTATVKLGSQTVTKSFDVTSGKNEVVIQISNKVEKAELTTKPTKTSYIQNSEPLDLTGGVITVTYSDGSTKKVSLPNSNVKVSNFDNSKVGTTTVTLEYEGITTTFDVQVVAKQISSVKITTNPTKTSYIQNSETLDLTGGILMVTYNDGSVDEISLTNENINATGFDNTKLGTNTITIKYGSFSATFTVKIVANKISKIEIATLPTKKKYIQNSEALDLTGGILTVTYDDKSTDEINMTNKNINVSNFDNSKLGINTISLEYNGYNTTFDVEIIEKEISKIELTTIPTKKKYIQNSETLDLTGGILMVTYNDGSVDEISLTNENINATGFDNSKLGINTISLEYNGYNTTFDVEIIEKEISKIEIATLPTKKKYIQNSETLDLTGGILTVTYDDKSTDEINMTNKNINASGFDNSKLGINTISLEYNGYNTTFDVEIIEKEISKIEIATLPTKEKYIQNSEPLDLTGGILMVTYNDGSVDEISLTNENINATGFDNSKQGTNIITIEYNGNTITFEVEILSNTEEIVDVPDTGIHKTIIMLIGISTIIVGTILFITSKKYAKKN